MPRQSEKRVRGRSLLGGGLAAAVVIIWLAWWQWDRLIEPPGAPPGEAGTPVQGPPSTPAAGLAPPGPGSAVEERWIERVGSAPVWPEDLSAPQDCPAVEADLARLCRVLDATERFRRAALPGGSCGLLQEAAVALSSRRPVLESELASHASILSNVFHLFRVVGRERLALLGGAMADNEDLAEPMALALYRWAVSRESCARSGRSPVRQAVLYDYAGFLFQTLGGQAYLRRRSSGVEALATFYALLVLDRAQGAGLNRHGIDARPEIRRARSLLAGRPLVFRERYLAILDEMDRRWESR